MFRPAIENLDSYYAPAGASGLGTYVAASPRLSVKLIDLLGSSKTAQTSRQRATLVDVSRSDNGA